MLRYVVSNIKLVCGLREQYVKVSLHKTGNIRCGRPLSGS